MDLENRRRNKMGLLQKDINSKNTNVIDPTSARLWTGHGATIE